MTDGIVLEIPLRLGRGLNERLHHMARARKVKHERHTTAWAIKLAKLQRPALPLVVTIIRGTTSHKPLDDDNLVGACKGVRDQLAEWLGVDDSDARVKWKYDQRCSLKQWAVGVRIDESPAVCQTAQPNV